MMTSEETHMMGLASDKIKQLRKQNEIMSIRLCAIDDMLTLFNAKKPLQSMGMEEDIAARIDKHLAEKNRPPQPAITPPPNPPPPNHDEIPF